MFKDNPNHADKGGASASPTSPDRQARISCQDCEGKPPCDACIAMMVRAGFVDEPTFTAAPAYRMNDSERLGYDAVNLPDHYRAFKIEPIHFCVENGLNMLQSSIIKYVVRYPHKNGVEDLRKAARMLDMAIAFEEGDPDWWRLPGERASRRTYII